MIRNFLVLNIETYHYNTISRQPFLSGKLEEILLDIKIFAISGFFAKSQIMSFMSHLCFSRIRSNFSFIKKSQVKTYLVQFVYNL